MINYKIVTVNIVLYIICLLCIIGILYLLFSNNKFLGKDSYDNFYDPKLEQLRSKIATAIPEIENVKISGSNKSFTINKKHVYICTKDENDEYYDDNMLIYVILHELAHVLCDEVGHTEKYKNIFRELLDRASRGGVYDPNKPPIDNYCNY
jgi:beta-lactamase regulating signal transducer with metallopeptidase domain